LIPLFESIGRVIVWNKNRFFNLWINYESFSINLSFNKFFIFSKRFFLN
jgi:hypothetical protein